MPRPPARVDSRNTKMSYDEFYYFKTETELNFVGLSDNKEPIGQR